MVQILSSPNSLSIDFYLVRQIYHIKQRIPPVNPIVNSIPQQCLGHQYKLAQLRNYFHFHYTHTIHTKQKKPISTFYIILLLDDISDETRPPPSQVNEIISLICIRIRIRNSSLLAPDPNSYLGQQYLWLLLQYTLGLTTYNNSTDTLNYTCCKLHLVSLNSNSLNPVLPTLRIELTYRSYTYGYEPSNYMRFLFLLP